MMDVVIRTFEHVEKWTWNIIFNSMAFSKYKEEKKTCTAMHSNGPQEQVWSLLFDNVNTPYFAPSLSIDRTEFECVQSCFCWIEVIPCLQVSIGVDLMNVDISMNG